MKTIVWPSLVGISLAAMMPQGAFAQGARRMMPDNRPPHPAPAAPRFPGRPRPAGSFLSPIYPLGFGGYGYDYDYVPQAPNVVVVAPPPPVYVPVPERPPETATLVVHEYQPPASATQALQSDQPVFAIVLKNSTVLSATAVIVQNDRLHIVDSDGGHQRVSLDAVDREATRRVNRERKLELQLPPGR